jgi:hypothetical protein
LTERIFFFKNIYHNRFCDVFYIPIYFSTVVTVTATAEAAMRVTATATAGEERVTVTAMTRATTVTATGDTATARKLAIVRSCRYYLFLLECLFWRGDSILFLPSMHIPDNYLPVPTKKCLELDPYETRVRIR